MPTESVEIRPATPDRWHDVVSVFGRRGDDPSWCWCRRFCHAGEPMPAQAGKTSDSRAALQDEISHAAIPPGLIAYVDGHPVGWSRIVPRRALPGIRDNRALARALGADDGSWWVGCFAVDNRYRRSGVGLALLTAAVAFAREHGAAAVEGHPVDVARLKSTPVAGSALFTGTMAMFAAAGFREVARTHPSRPVMRLVL